LIALFTIIIGFGSGGELFDKISEDKYFNEKDACKYHEASHISYKLLPHQEDRA